MKPPSRATWQDAPTARRLGITLVAAFFSTALLFVVSSAVANYRERGILRAAESVSNVALPSMQHLSGARTELRHVEVLLDDLTGGATSERSPEEIRGELRRTRERLAGEWRDYKVLPVYPGEAQLQATAEESLHSMSASVDETIRRLDAGDERGAQRIRKTRIPPAVERFDDALSALLNLDAARGRGQSERIATLRKQAVIWGVSLHVLSVLFATVFGILLVRVVRRYVRVTDLRVSELEHFAGRVAHDIRSPLSSVGLALELSKKEPGIDEKTCSRLERAGRTVQRIGQLVDGLLVFALGGAPPPQESRSDVQEVLRGVMDGMLPRAQEADIDLKTEIVNPGSVACTPGVLTSVFANLIGNAVKYMGDASVRRITVRARDIGTMMRMEVQDTGPGVPQELRQRIFDPYVRAATTSSVGGLGLGLATVRRLVEAHGGAVGVEANPGGGSLFWFQLPKPSSAVETPERAASDALGVAKPA